MRTDCTQLAINLLVFRYSVKLSFSPSDLDHESHVTAIAATEVALNAKKTVRRVFNLSTFRLDSVRQFKKVKILDRLSSLY